MNQHHHQTGGDRLARIHVPCRDQREARAAILCPDGGESYIAAQDRKFTMENHVEAVKQSVSVAQARTEKLERELSLVERKLVWTPEFVSKPSETARVSRTRLLGALVLAAVTVVGMGVSVTVLSEYALRSASSLFADNNVVTAVLFATLPCLAAVSLKVFEQKLVNPDARWLFGVLLFGAGLASLAVWLVSTAVALAPDLGGSSALLSDNSAGNMLGMALLLSTVMCEICLGSTVLLGVGDLLAPKQQGESIPNPAYGALLIEKQCLTRELDDCLQVRAAAQDYLVRAEAGRELTRREAEVDLTRASEVWIEAQRFALALAIIIFLGHEGEQS